MHTITLLTDSKWNSYQSAEWHYKALHFLDLAEISTLDSEIVHKRQLLVMNAIVRLLYQCSKTALLN